MTVIAFEARLAKTVGDLVRLQGGDCFSAPSMKEVPLEENKAVFDFGADLADGKIDVLVLLTGVGARALVSVLESQKPKDEIIGQLKKIKIVPRGPKPLRFMNETGLTAAVHVPEPNTWKEILSALDAAGLGLSGKRVAVQEYGVPNEEFVAGLKDRGASVTRVPVYRWTLPDDLGPMEEAIDRLISGRAQVALFTTSAQADHLLRVAAGKGKSAALLQAFKKSVVASVGPDCTETLVRLDIPVDIEPESPKMGPLVQLAAEKARGIWEKKNAR
jgi:uroporphyrinogen-III synthase